MRTLVNVRLGMQSLAEKFDKQVNHGHAGTCFNDKPRGEPKVWPLVDKLWPNEAKQPSEGEACGLEEREFFFLQVEAVNRRAVELDGMSFYNNMTVRRWFEIVDMYGRRATPHEAMNLAIWNPELQYGASFYCLGSWFREEGDSGHFHFLKLSGLDNGIRYADTDQFFFEGLDSKIKGFKPFPPMTMILMVHEPKPKKS